jgi:outer membrane biogenesis lipoprotein LolB
MIIKGGLCVKKLIIFIVLAALLLAACSNKISSKEAEDIAINQAVEEGYSNPRLFTDYSTTTSESYIYSKKHQKDVLVWEVVLVTDERPREEGMLGDLYYYVHIETGEIVHKVSGVF